MLHDTQKKKSLLLSLFPHSPTSHVGRGGAGRCGRWGGAGRAGGTGGGLVGSVRLVWAGGGRAGGPVAGGRAGWWAGGKSGPGRVGWSGRSGRVAGWARFGKSGPSSYIIYSYFRLHLSSGVCGRGMPTDDMLLPILGMLAYSAPDALTVPVLVCTEAL